MPERYSRRRMGDRSDGRRLRTLSPIFALTPYVVRFPADAVNSFTDEADLAPIERWLDTQRAVGVDLTLTHVFIAAYIRTLAQFPALNRFVAGRGLYARDRIEIVLSSGRSGSADAGSMAIKVRFLPTDTVFDVARKITSQVESIKADEEASRLERAAAALVKTPRFVLRMGVGVLRWLDYHGWLGGVWLERSPFHGSAVISDEGSDRLPSMSRSLNSVGSLPLSLSVGRRRTGYELTKSGTLLPTRTIDYTVSVDTRIADSAYIGAAFRAFRHCLAHPEALENTPARVNEDTL